MSNLSQWSKDVKKALIDRDMTMNDLAAKVGKSQAVISSVIGGRYSNSTYKDIVEQINKVLGTEGMPERVATPSDEWCCAVKVELVKRNMTVNDLAEQSGVSRDRMSLVINGKMNNEKIVAKVVELLGISVPVMSSN